MRRSRPDPEALKAAREHARHKRVEAGLPPEAPEDALYADYWKKKPRKKAKGARRR